MTPQVLPEGLALYCVIAAVALWLVTLPLQNQVSHNSGGQTARQCSFTTYYFLLCSILFSVLPCIHSRTGSLCVRNEEKRQVFDAILVSLHCVWQIRRSADPDCWIPPRASRVYIRGIGFSRLRCGLFPQLIHCNWILAQVWARTAIMGRFVECCSHSRSPLLSLSRGCVLCSMCVCTV